MALPQTRVPGRQEVRARRDVAVEEPGDGDPDRREPVQDRVAAQLVGDPQRAGARGRASAVSPRWAIGQRRVGLVEDLADEERVARRAPVHVGGVELVAFEQLGDGGPAQRRELHAAHTRRGDEIAHHRAQRGIGADRVAAGHDHQQRQRVDAAGEEAHEVGGRLVGPVQVFHDEHAGRLAQGVQHRGEDLVLGRRVAQACGDGGPEPARDVAQRAERARGAQRVAHAPQHRHRHPLGERAEQRRLADARLTDEQHHCAATRRRPLGPGLQHVDRVFALQQPHR